jgi:hypothetical protein
MALVIAYPNGDIHLVDLWGNDLLAFPLVEEVDWTTDKIVSMEGSPTTDEQFVAILTESGKAFVIEWEVRRKVENDRER